MIVEIGGEKIATMSAYHTQLLKQEVGSSVTFRGKRKGNEEYVDAEYKVTIGSRE